MFSPRWRDVEMDEEQSRKLTDKRVYARINFLSKIPDVKKPATQQPAGLHTLKNDKFFEPEPRPSTQRAIKRAKIVRIDSLNNINGKKSEANTRPVSTERVNLGLLQLKEHISELTSWRNSELCVSSVVPEKLKNITFPNANLAATTNKSSQSQTQIAPHNSPRPTTAISSISKSVPKLQLGLVMSQKARPQTTPSHEYAFITARVDTEERNEPQVIHSHRSEVKSRETSREASRAMRKRLFSRPTTARVGPESYRENRRASEATSLADCMMHRPLLTERTSHKEEKEIEFGGRVQSQGDVGVLHLLMKDVKKRIKIRGLRGLTGPKVKSLVEVSGAGLP